MTDASVLSREKLMEAMNNGKPVKSFIKTILGKVHVIVWDVFEEKPVGIILEGDPAKKEDGSYVDLYSDYEVNFFKRANKRHFDLGNLIEFSKDSKKKDEKTIEGYTDDELKEVINSPFLKLQSLLNKTTSEATLYRMEILAQQMEKSDKVLSAIRGRLSEVQNASVSDFPQQIEEEVE